MPGPSTRVVTLPNLLSSSRFVLAAGFLMADGASVRLGLLGLASFTDFFDGWLARRQRLTSRLGAILDPIADRVFVIAVVVAFLASGDLLPWQAGALLVRDAMTIIGWIVARSAPALRAILVQPAAVTPLVVLAAALGVVATVDYTLMLWRERRVDG